MKYSPFEFQLLRLIEMSPKTSVVELAGQLSRKVHKVRYAIQRFEEDGILQRTIPVLNPSVWGYHELCMYLSLHNASVAQRRRFIDTCKTIPGLAWLTPCGGPYEYFSSYCLASHRDLSNILSTLSTSCGAVFREKSIGELIDFSYFGKKYLAPSLPTAALHYSSSGVRCTLDSAERAILSAMQQAGATSLRDLAAATGVSLSTVARKMEELSRSGVLVGYMRRVDIAALGIQAYRVLLKLSDLREVFFNALRKYCAKHERCISLARYVGPWDADIRIELPATENPAPFIQELEEHFSAAIVNTALISLYQPLVMNNFPYAENKRASR